MTTPARRMKAMRERRKIVGRRELRLVIPDARDPAVRRRVAEAVAHLSPSEEDDALAWIESVAEFGDDHEPGQ